MLDTDKNQYILREGFTHTEGDTVIAGPELLFLSLDAAYAIRHKLEEAGEIVEQWKKQNADKLAAKRVDRLVSMYLRAGVTKEEATKKAGMIVRGEKPQKTQVAATE